MSIACVVTVDSWVDQIKDRLVQRKDDQEEKVLEKLKEYHGNDVETSESCYDMLLVLVAVFDQVENLFPQAFKVGLSEKTVSNKVMIVVRLTELSI